MSSASEAKRNPSLLTNLVETFCNHSLIGIVDGVRRSSGNMIFIVSVSLLMVFVKFLSSNQTFLNNAGSFARRLRGSIMSLIEHPR
jgi:hypothetical protein